MQYHNTTISKRRYLQVNRARLLEKESSELRQQTWQQKRNSENDVNFPNIWIRTRYSSK